MAERWTNAVITITKPLDVFIEADDFIKQEAVHELLGALGDVWGEEFADAVATGRWEDVWSDLSSVDGGRDRTCRTCGGEGSVWVESPGVRPDPETGEWGVTDECPECGGPGTVAPASPSGETGGDDERGAPETEPHIEALREEVGTVREAMMRLVRGNDCGWRPRDLRSEAGPLAARGPISQIALFGLLNDGELRMDNEMLVWLAARAAGETGDGREHWRVVDANGDAVTAWSVDNEGAARECLERAARVQPAHRQPVRLQVQTVHTSPWRDVREIPSEGAKTDG